VVLPQVAVLLKPTFPALADTFCPKMAF